MKFDLDLILVIFWQNFAILTLACQVRSEEGILNINHTQFYEIFLKNLCKNLKKFLNQSVMSIFIQTILEFHLGFIMYGGFIREQNEFS